MALLFDRTLAAMTGPKGYRIEPQILRTAQPPALKPEPEPEPEPQPEVAEEKPELPSLPVPPRGLVRVVLAPGAASDTATPSAADPAEGDFGPAPPPAPAIGVILDASGSMLQRLDGRRRIEIAREALNGLVLRDLPPGSPFALTAFGFERGACQLRTIQPFGPLDPGLTVSAVAGIDAINQARTPIAAALADMADRLVIHEGPQTIVLVTDGEETCDGDVPGTIRDLRAQGFDLRVNIVGFAIDDAGLKATFAEWARLGGGVYLDAADAAGLAAQLTRSTEAPPPPPPSPPPAPFVEMRARGAETLARLRPGEERALPSGHLRVGREGIAAFLQPDRVLVIEVDATGTPLALRTEERETTR